MLLQQQPTCRSSSSWRSRLSAASCAGGGGGRRSQQHEGWGAAGSGTAQRRGCASGLQPPEQTPQGTRRTRLRLHKLAGHVLQLVVRHRQLLLGGQAQALLLLLRLARRPHLLLQLAQRTLQRLSVLQQEWVGRACTR